MENKMEYEPRTMPLSGRTYYFERNNSLPYGNHFRYSNDINLNEIGRSLHMESEMPRVRILEKVEVKVGEPSKDDKIKESTGEQTAESEESSQKGEIREIIEEQFPELVYSNRSEYISYLSERVNMLINDFFADVTRSKNPESIFTDGRLENLTGIIGEGLNYLEQNGVSEEEMEQFNDIGFNIAYNIANLINLSPNFTTHSAITKERIKANVLSSLERVIKIANNLNRRFGENLGYAIRGRENQIRGGIISVENIAEIKPEDMAEEIRRSESLRVDDNFEEKYYTDSEETEEQNDKKKKKKKKKKEEKKIEQIPEELEEKYYDDEQEQNIQEQNTKNKEDFDIALNELNRRINTITRNVPNDPVEFAERIGGMVAGFADEFSGVKITQENAEGAEGKILALFNRLTNFYKSHYSNKIKANCPDEVSEEFSEVAQDFVEFIKNAIGNSDRNTVKFLIDDGEFKEFGENIAKNLSKNISSRSKNIFIDESIKSATPADALNKIIQENQEADIAEEEDRGSKYRDILGNYIKSNEELREQLIKNIGTDDVHGMSSATFSEVLNIINGRLELETKKQNEKDGWEEYYYSGK